jgi:L-lactate permease
LLFLLGVMRRPAWVAGLSGLAVTIVLATVGYHMPLVPALSAVADGAAFGLFPISWIVFWAICLFRVTVETGEFEVIKNSIGSLTSDPRLQALLIAFAFGAFVEGAAGFGTPVAIASTMLTGLGFSAFSASAICLLANTAPVAFGSIGIPVVTLAGTTGLPLDKLSGAVGRLCAYRLHHAGLPHRRTLGIPCALRHLAARPHGRRRLCHGTVPRLQLFSYRASKMR